MSDLATMSKMAIRKLRNHVNDSAHSRFMFAIAENAILDLTLADQLHVKSKSKRIENKTNYKSAVTYLNGDAIHFEMAGIDASYARRVLNSIGFKEINPS